MAILFLAAQCGSFIPGFDAAFRWMPRAVRGSVYMNFFLASGCLALVSAAAMALNTFGPRVAWALSLVTAVELIAVSSGRPMNTEAGSWRQETGETAVIGNTEVPRLLSGLVSQKQPSLRIDVLDRNSSFTMGASTRRLPTPNGDNPFAPLRLLELRLLFAQGDWWERHYPVTKPESPLLDFLNVEYLLADTAHEDPDLLRHAGWHTAGNAGWLRLYRNPEVQERFFLVGRVHRAADRADALRLVQSTDLRTEAVVEGYKPTVESAGVVKVQRYSLNEAALETEAPAASFLVSSESFHPGWRATVDGRPTEIALTNYAYRGLAVPPGRHRVVMRYEGGLLWLWALISFVSWVAVGLVLGISGFRAASVR